MDQQWPQGLGFSAAAINSALVSEGSCVGSGNPPPLAAAERRARPHKERALNCPRCNSGNTKFCYYNNYSLTQPRHFCKTCRRYWTEGGSLRNVPVGGGSRKNKRSYAASSGTKPAATTSSSASVAAAHSKFYGVQDLNLGSGAVPENYSALPDLELISSSIKSGGMPGSARGVVGPLPQYSAGAFGLLQEEFRPAATLNFALDHGGKMLFPPEELKPALVLPSFLNLADRHQLEGQQQNGGDPPPPPPPPPGFWNGLIHGGEGSW